tara:strand:- start:70 stop:411 length:342 start_codon:yes stop_codon:yes gene_type:complete
MNETQRILAYLLVCLPVRSIPIIVLFYTRKFNILISLLYLGMGLSFLYQTTTIQERQLGFLGGKIWWLNLRYLHALVYLLVAVLLYQGEIKKVRCLLIADLLVGLIGFVNNYG